MKRRGAERGCLMDVGVKQKKLDVLSLSLSKEGVANES